MNRTLREIVRILASRFLGMVLILVVMLGAAGVVTWFSPRWYRSETTLLAKPSRMVNPLEQQQIANRDQVSLFVATQREIIKSDDVLAAALLQLDGWDGGGEGPSDQEIRQYIDQNTTKMRQVSGYVNVVTPGGPDATFTQTFTIRVDWPEQRSEAAKLATGSDVLAARKAQAFAQHLVKAYLHRYVQLERQRASAGTKFLTEKSLAAARTMLDSATAELQAFIDQELKGDLLQLINMASTGGGLETGEASLKTGAQAQINAMDARLKELRTLQKVLDTELAKKDSAELVVPDAVTRGNSSVGLLQEKIIRLKLRLNELQPRYTEAYQELRNVKAELAEARSDLRDQLTKQRTRTEQEITLLSSRRDELASHVAQSQKRVDDLAAKAANYQRLQRAVTTAQGIYDAERQRVASAVTAEQLASNPILVTVLGGPSRPDPVRPRRPIVWLNMLVALVAAVIIALAYAFLADHFDHSIKGVGDAERYLGVPVLGSIPKLGRGIVRVR
ncbi:MAG: Wzz/FepE/Etk N-terminal domain-containing protein [Planctomycetota bacterium]|nr:Wzz/FepE/Etk N-terminal domain-containing protein [Planctomycetota bacterium]